MVKMAMLVSELRIEEAEMWGRHLSQSLARGLALLPQIGSQ